MLSLLEHKKTEIESKILTRGGHLPGFDYRLRTPMHDIMGMTDLLLDTELNEDQRSYAENIKASNDSLYMSINEIMDYSRICTSRMELNESDFNLRTLMEEIDDYMAFCCSNKDVNVSTVIDAKVPEVIIGDRMRVRQILLNLATNAINFTDQGEISLSVCCIERMSQEEDANNSSQNVIKPQTLIVLGRWSRYERTITVKRI